MHAHTDPIWFQKMSRLQPNPHRLLHLSAALEAQSSQRRARLAERRNQLLHPVRNLLAGFFYRLAERLAP